MSNSTVKPSHSRSRVSSGLNNHEHQLDGESETTTNHTVNMNFNQHTSELLADVHEEDMNFDVDLKTFENLELNSKPYSTTTVQANNDHFYSTSLPSCSTINDAEPSTNRPTRSLPASEDGSPFIKSTGYVLGHFCNPVDIAVDGNILAIADYDNGVYFINLDSVDCKNATRRHFKTAPYRIAGVQFLHETHSDRIHVVLLAYIDEKWTCNIHLWPDLVQEYVIDHPTEPFIPSYSRRKIKVIGETLYLLGTSEQCSAIWTLHLPTSAWKTLMVERGRPQNTLGISLANTLLLAGHSNNKASVYSDFDVHNFSKSEHRIVLCDAVKSQLNILVLIEPNQLVDKQTIKVKRRKREAWIVKGPRLAVFDSDGDLVVFDNSNKIFWFDGNSYRIRKIVGDLGRSQCHAIIADRGWTYALSRDDKCVHAFLYR
ncbi:hypothetical protein M3Y95_01167600 [Aphelenchoides besseyi]|nr:hypothetical protein M3Y95_01167600 [Aphelenchoides besseyi]